jgi:hypothetical protein
MTKASLILFLPLMFISGLACTQNNTVTFTGTSFTLEYEPPTTELEPYATFLKSSGVFEEVMADLESLFKLPVPVRVIFSSEDAGPYYYKGVVNMPYQFLRSNDQLVEAIEYDGSDEEKIDLILDLTEFVLYHEVGHALIDMLDIPVLGKEEDAVDGFAAVLAATMDLDDVALAAADIFDMGLELAEDEISEAEFWDSHSLDEQRMFTIFCLIHGSDPGEHAQLLKDVGMPTEKTDECQYNYQETLRNWSRVLQGYIRN